MSKKKIEKLQIVKGTIRNLEVFPADGNFIWDDKTGILASVVAGGLAASGNMAGSAVTQASTDAARRANSKAKDHGFTCLIGEVPVQGVFDRKFAFKDGDEVEVMIDLLPQDGAYKVYTIRRPRDQRMWYQLICAWGPKRFLWVGLKGSFLGCGPMMWLMAGLFGTITGLFSDDLTWTYIKILWGWGLIIWPIMGIILMFPSLILEYFRHRNTSRRIYSTWGYPDIDWVNIEKDHKQFIKAQAKAIKENRLEGEPVIDKIEGDFSYYYPVVYPIPEDVRIIDGAHPEPDILQALQASKINTQESKQA